MKFVFKVFEPINGVIDKSKFRMDDMVANNEDELRQACEMLGYKYEITERMGTPEQPNLAGVPKSTPLTPEEMAMGKIPAPPGIAPYYPGGGIAPTPQKPPVVEFEDNGVKFKVECGSVFKKDWVDVKSDEYRIVNTVNGSVVINTPSANGMDGLKVQKLDWIKVK